MEQYRAVWNRTDKTGLILNIALALGLVFAVNAFIFFVNPGEESRTAPASPVPGYVIGIIWTILFLAMAIARWQALRSADPSRKLPSLILALILLCAAYPLYTVGLRSLSVGIAGNILTGIFALWIALRAWRPARAVALLLAPVILWLIYATFLTAHQIRSPHP